MKGFYKLGSSHLAETEQLKKIYRTPSQNILQTPLLYRKTRKNEIDKDVFLKNLSITLGNIAMILTEVWPQQILSCFLINEFVDMLVCFLHNFLQRVCKYLIIFLHACTHFYIFACFSTKYFLFLHVLRYNFKQ